MDQNDYYTIYNDFQQFLHNNNLDLNFDLDKNNNSNTEDNNIILMNNHIKELHKIILNEISKKGINNTFLLKLKTEINNYTLNN